MAHKFTARTAILAVLFLVSAGTAATFLSEDARLTGQVSSSSACEQLQKIKDQGMTDNPKIAERMQQLEQQCQARKGGQPSPSLKRTTLGSPSSSVRPTGTPSQTQKLLDENRHLQGQLALAQTRIADLEEKLRTVLTDVLSNDTHAAAPTDKKAQPTASDLEFEDGFEDTKPKKDDDQICSIISLAIGIFGIGHCSMF